MLELLLPSLIAMMVALLCILPFKSAISDFWRRLLGIGIYHLLYSTFLLLPIGFSFQISGTSLNWIGKLLAICFSVGFYIFWKQDMQKSDFITTRLAKGSLKKILWVGGLVTLVMCGLTLAFSSGKLLDFERLAYQVSMPGLDEELWRGILLGLMIPLIKGDRFRLGHPAVWVTSLLFALMHALYIIEGNFGFATDVFIVTGVLGYVLGWTTLKSKSILPAMVLHNLINFSTNFIEMILL